MDAQQTPAAPNAQMWVCELGLVPYGEALALQQELSERRQADQVPDTLLLLEHPPTYTRGRRAAFPGCRWPRVSASYRAGARSAWAIAASPSRRVSAPRLDAPHAESTSRCRCWRLPCERSPLALEPGRRRRAASARRRCPPP